MASVLTMTAQTNMELTAAQVAAQMAPGWNLGNTMEGGGSDQNFKNSGVGTETWWQHTKTTQAIIDYVKAQGFRSVRIPCAWIYGHISDADTYTIDAAWMARVKEVVDYCISDGLYVVLNDHWDGGWLEDNIHVTDAATVNKNKQILEAVWTQIATAFKDYDEHLLFAGLNEPDKDLDGSKWTQTVINQLIDYEQTFIDAVRATGGNNAKRVLVIQGPKTDINTTVKAGYVNNLPDDDLADRLMMEVHYYDPWQFWGMEKDESWGKVWYYWGADNHLSGSTHNTSSSYEESYVRSQLQKMKTHFVDKGMPVIIGEYGANWRDLSSLTGESQEKHNASIKAFYKVFNQTAIEMGMVPMAWDINSTSQNGAKGVMTLIKRADCTIYNRYAMEGIQEAVATSVPQLLAENAPSATGDNAWYTLSGQKLAQGNKLSTGQLPKGIYIRDGKKYVVE